MSSDLQLGHAEFKPYCPQHNVLELCYDDVKKNRRQNQDLTSKRKNGHL